MRHIHRISAALAVAGAAFMLAAPATPAAAAVVASPAGVAGSSSSPMIDVTHGQFNLIVPNARVGNSPTALAIENPITAFHGFSSLQTLTIQSQGFDLEGRITGRLRSHNYEAIYQVYNLPKASKWDLWGISFKKDQSQSVLKQTWGTSQLVDLNVDLSFRVAAADLRGVSTLRIGFETLRLTLNGTTKDFTVVNGASGSAVDQSGNDIPVDFEPI
jgi:hypothetical protein